jgi:AcrR family transcriptional regulator
MVQKQAGKPRGRPREYDPEKALARATEAFWDNGFAGTSLDDLSARMGMNRPSMYAAFGDKEALYLGTLESYIAGRHATIQAVLGSGVPLAEALRSLYRRMIDRFLEGQRGARGCYLLATAVTEAVGNPRVRERLADAQRDIDRLYREAFANAQARGEIESQADPATLAMLASAVGHTLALRARGGQPRARLLALADSAAEFICAGGSRTPQKRRARA